MSVVIETTLGDITVDLFVQERPQTCMNFLKLCKIKYYNLCLFHSVSANFLAQTGDPTGKGDGGESIFGVLNGKHRKLYQGEKIPKIKHDRSGLLSMVSHGDGMLGSQFFITLSSNLAALDNEHCVFGKIVEGEELLLKLNQAVTDDKNRPYQDIRITHTVVLEDPFPDPENLEVPPLSPLPPNSKDVAYSRIPADEVLTGNYRPVDLEEMVQQREAAARAAILEMVGDIPDADSVPPDNVLFVCKLNPVTSDHDLSIIFSRFGTVKSCEVIKDQVTGDSLQYAFVEFEDRKSCEEAYFKMDNVLIDDRRIHVDFSQSVAKLKWKGKGKGVEVLGPPPPGGWGNNVTENRQDGKPKFDERRRNDFDTNRRKRKYSDQYNSDPVKNGENSRELNLVPFSRRNDNEGKDIKRKTKRRTRSSSSSSSSGSSSGSSSTSETSASSYRRKKNKSHKVFLLVKTPRRSKNYKKQRKTKNKKYRSESESESLSDNQKKKKKRSRRKSSSSDDSSSSKEVDKKRKRKRRSSSSEDEPRGKKRKKKTKDSDTSETSSEDEKKKNKNRKRRAKDSSSESDSSRNKRSKREKTKSKKKRQGKKSKRSHHRYESDTSSSSD